MERLFALWSGALCRMAKHDWNSLFPRRGVLWRSQPGFLLSPKYVNTPVYTSMKSGRVGIVNTGIQDHQVGRIPTADRAEAALVAGARNELPENIVCGVSLRSAFVDCIDRKVGG